MSALPLILLFTLFLSTVSSPHHHHHHHKHKKPPQFPPFEPMTFFEVTYPIPIPSKTPCAALLLTHNFASTYGHPPITTPYTPPNHCLHRRPSRIVLNWSASSQGRQFDRIFGVWLGGVELLRGCTAEPRPTGVFWTVNKDVTRYAAVFAQSSTLTVSLDNVINANYTGVYHVNVSVQFYFDSVKHAVPSFASPADIVVPVSRELSFNEGQWFRIENKSDVQSKKVIVPRNAYRALLEVYVSFHQSDEFWYMNPPNSYIVENNINGIAGNGPFREVTAWIDGELVGAVWPFTVIHTGGINPLLWRPISAIGSFSLPTYDIDITPFLGRILDGKEHEFAFGVTDALDVWFVDGNLHIWVDGLSSRTTGGLIKHEAPKFVPALFSQFQGLDGHFKTTSRRRISLLGWVNSSYGTITTQFYQEFEYENIMKFAENGTVQVVNQTINSKQKTSSKDRYSVMYTSEVYKNFPLYVYYAGNGETNEYITNVSLGFNERRIAGEKYRFHYSSLSNHQTAQGVMHLNGSLLSSGLGSTQQAYKYESSEGCYFRNVSSTNYTLLYDEKDESCIQSWWPLEEHLLDV